MPPRASPASLSTRPRHLWFSFRLCPTWRPITQSQELLVGGASSRSPLLQFKFPGTREQLIIYICLRITHRIPLSVTELPPTNYPGLVLAPAAIFIGRLPQTCQRWKTAIAPDVPDVNHSHKWLTARKSNIERNSALLLSSALSPLNSLVNSDQDRRQHVK